MLPYYLLVGIPIILSLINYKKPGKIRDKKIALWVFFAILLIMLALRGVECGVDLQNYKSKFRMVGTVSVRSLFNLSLIEPGYTLFSSVNKLLFGSFQLHLLICAILSIVPIAVLYIKKSNHPLLTIALFVGVAPFSMFFSGLRQSIAMGLGVICYYYCKKNKILPFLLMVFLAFLFHQSATILLIMYPLTHIRITKKWLMPAAILYFVFLKFNTSFFKIILTFNSKYEERYVISETGSYTFLVLLVILIIYCFIIPDDQTDDVAEMIGLRNILLLSCYIQCFAPVNTSVMRLNYYYLIFIPILIPMTIDNCKNEYRGLVKFSSIIFAVFFIFWFFKEAHTGKDILQIFPYVSFWG